jgi:hypothetical protein
MTMRQLRNAIAGAAGLMVLCGALSATPAAANSGSANRPEPSNACPTIHAPEGAYQVFHAYAEGVQIYRWDGQTWVFLAPEATLYADAGHHGQVGIHYGGPTWESNSGSKVVCRAVDRCTPDMNSIPWLSLESTYSAGPGVFDGVTTVLRVNTVGGIAPAGPGAFDGEVRRVPYTAEYYFYTGQE